MAHRKAGGSTRLGRDSQSQRLGVKLYEGEIAKAGAIIIRQRGTKFNAGENVRRGNDDSLYALKEGKVHFFKRKKKKFDGSMKMTQIVSVIAK